MKKRLFAVLASLCMVVSMVPTMAFAQDSGTTIGVSDLCEHHTEHTSDCGYTEGTLEQPCAHEHTDECYAIAGQCVHTAHDESCGGLADPTACTHVCGEDTGCVIKTLNCQHQHNESCGYVPATAGTPCTFVCEVCNAQDSGNPAAPSDAQPGECTCETLCTGEEINADCPVCGAEDANLNKCKGLEALPATLSNALPVTALAAAPSGQVLYVGGEQISTTGYWTTDSEGNVTAYSGTEAPTDNYIHYDAQNNVLTLHNATIKKGLEYSENIEGGTYIFGSAIGVLNRNGAAELTITLEGTNTIAEVGKGIFVLASSTSTGGATLTITGGGSLNASASQTGIWVQSNSNNAALCVKNAEVTASADGAFKNGVLVQAKEGSDVSLTVNGGSLTASVNANIWFQFGSGASGSGTPTVTVSNNAIVRANGGIANNSSSPILYGTGGESTGGIVFDGNTGTVYGSVTLQENITIGEGESLTIPDNSSLDTNGNTVTVENGGNLTGEVNRQQPPRITISPQSQTVTAGTPAAFSVIASASEGDSLTYQWQQKTTESGSEWKDISGATTASYTTEATTMDMSGTQYRCVVTGTNIGVSVISAPATLTVNEPVTYTITVHGSAGGTATADKTAAAAGEIITLTATPASGYHFDGWNIVSGSVTIQNNQFTMPAENVEIQAVFDRNSSSRGSDSSYTQRQEEFWDEVKEQIRDADPGDTIKVNARSYDRLPYSVMKLLGEQDDVTLRISWNDGDPIEIPSAFAANEPQRVYYPLEELAEMDFTQSAEPEADKPETETSAGTDATTGTTGDTSGSWTGGTVTQPAESQPEAEEPDTEPESEPETEPESEPTISEPDEETMTEPERGELPMSWVLGGAVIVIAVGAGGFWFWKRRSQE